MGFDPADDEGIDRGRQRTHRLPETRVGKAVELKFIQPPDRAEFGLYFRQQRPDAGRVLGGGQDRQCQALGRFDEQHAVAANPVGFVDDRHQALLDIHHQQGALFRLQMGKGSFHDNLH